MNPTPATSSIPSANPFQSLGPRYDQGSNPEFYRKLSSRLLDLALEGAKDPPDSILDLGCGTGVSTRVLAGRFPHHPLVGADQSAAMLAVARERPFPGPAGWVQCPAEALPFEDESFSLVFCNMAYHWCHPRAAQEMRRVLKPGGRIALSVPLRGPDLALAGNLALLGLVRKRGPLAGRGNRRRRGLTLDELEVDFPGSRVEVHNFTETFHDRQDLALGLETRGVLAACVGQPVSTTFPAGGLPALDPPEDGEAGPGVAFRWSIALLVKEPAA